MESIQFWIYQITFWASALTISSGARRQDNFFEKFLLVLVGQSGLNLLLHFFFLHESTGIEILACLCSAGLMACSFWICFKMTKTMAVYNTIWAISIWQLLKEIWNLFEGMLPQQIQGDMWTYFLGMCIHFGIGLLLCGKTIAKWMPMDRKNWIGPRQLTSAICLFGMIAAQTLSPTLHAPKLNGEWGLVFLSQCFCVVILYLQNEIFKREYMKDEINMMKLLLKKEQEQYRMTRENIALLNQKCHDMKHQIQAIRAAGKEQQEEYLSGLEETVNLYEAIVKTGNEVLDTILTDKSLYCKDRQIKVSCVVDGSQLHFIKSIDLYSLLGNALDNAIEAVEKFQMIEKRQIDVLIYRQQKFLVLNIINPVKVGPVYEEEGELPVTTKKDKNYHGFGLRSMKYILEKYDGHLNVMVEDDCFDLKMLIPIPEEGEGSVEMDQ